jgi:hypothetical protein
MVFSSKSSTVSTYCRTRKPHIRLHGRRETPGYGDGLSLMFHNKLDGVVQEVRPKQNIKHHGERKPKGIAAVPSLSCMVDDLNADYEYPPAEEEAKLITFNTPTPNIEDLATSFFMSNYVVSATDFALGHMESAPLLYNQSRHQGALSVTITAVGLALISNISRTPRVMVIARQRLVIALRKTNEALQHPRESKANSTLMAVLLLSFYEVSVTEISCNSTSDLL